MCVSLVLNAQTQINKLPDHIHRIFIEFDNQLGFNSIKNIDQFKLLFHKNMTDSVRIPHDLYYTGLEYGFIARSPLTIDNLDQVFKGNPTDYYTNISKEFFQFGERVTLQSRFGYKLYQYKLNRMLYYRNYKANRNEFAEIPYYITLLSYNDPNNSTLKRASILKVSDQKTEYPPWYLPESFQLGYQYGIAGIGENANITNLENSEFHVKANYLLTGKKNTTYYLQFGVGLLNSSFCSKLPSFTESFSAIDFEMTPFTKYSKYNALSQDNKISMLEIPIAFKVQYYQYKNIFNFFGSLGTSYYTPMQYSVSNTSGQANYYGNYQFGNGLSIDLKNLPEYGFTNYSVTPDNKNATISPNFSVNAEAGVNLRINKNISLESSIGIKYFLNEFELAEPLQILGEGEGKIQPLIQSNPPSLSMVTLNAGLTYNLFPVRSPYYPVVDKKLLNLKGQKLKKGGLTSEKIKLSPASDFMMKDLKHLEYQFRRDNLSISMRGKVSKSSKGYFLKVKVPKGSNYVEIVKPINYDIYSNTSDQLSDNMLLTVNMNDVGAVNISKITDLDVVVIFKFSSSHPNNKFDLYKSMVKKVDAICSTSSDKEKILFANSGTQLIKPQEDCLAFSTYLENVQDELDVTDMNMLEDFITQLKSNSIITKRRNINIHFIYLYKEMVFNTFEQSYDYLQMYQTNIELISNLEKEVFGNNFNNIKIQLWSNFTPIERDLLNKYRTIDQINWEYNIY
jgi:hypothetical protein